MNDDIKETLEYKIDFLTKSLNIGIPTKSRRYFNDIKNYITNLQQELKYQEEAEIEYNEKHTKLMEDFKKIKEENERLNKENEKWWGIIKDYEMDLHDLCNKNNELEQEKEDYKSRIEKAVEYLKQEEISVVYQEFGLLPMNTTDDLLNILNGRSDE